jgi:hypothetical protein
MTTPIFIVFIMVSLEVTSWLPSAVLWSFLCNLIDMLKILQDMLPEASN